MKRDTVLQLRPAFPLRAPTSLSPHVRKPLVSSLSCLSWHATLEKIRAIDETKDLSLFLEEKGKKKKNVLISKQRDRVTRRQNRYPFYPLPFAHATFSDCISAKAERKDPFKERRISLQAVPSRGTHPGKEDGKIRDARRMFNEGRRK